MRIAIAALSLLALLCLVVGAQYWLHPHVVAGAVSTGATVRLSLGAEHLERLQAYVDSGEFLTAARSESRRSCGDVASLWGEDNSLFELREKDGRLQLRYSVRGYAGRRYGLFFVETRVRPDSDDDALNQAVVRAAELNGCVKLALVNVLEEYALAAEE